MNKLITLIRRAAAGYEPAVVASVAAAFFVLLAGLGITVGDFPDKVNAILTFVAFVAPILGGAATRAKVTPTKSLQDDGGE